MSIENLVKLFAIGDVVLNSRMDPEQFESFKPRYDEAKRAAIDELNVNTTQVSFGDLVYALDRHWPNVTIEASATRGFDVGSGHGIVRGSLEVPYSSGHRNASKLFLNPTSSKDQYGAARISTSVGNSVVEISNNPIMTWNLVMEDGKTVPDRADAFKVYLDAFEKNISDDVFQANRDGNIPKKFFFLGADYGISLIGFGDALFKIAKLMPNREAEINALAKRAYESSGFKDTLYVANQILKLGNK